MDDNIAKCTENFVGECFIGKNIISNFIYYLVIVVLIHRKLFCFITWYTSKHYFFYIYVQGKDISVVFCGDFNSTPEHGIMQLMTEKHVPVDYKDWRYGKG